VVEVVVVVVGLVLCGFSSLTLQGSIPPWCSPLTKLGCRNTMHNSLSQLTSPQMQVIGFEEELSPRMPVGSHACWG
jgi:hypothetical protein